LLKFVITKLSVCITFTYIAGSQNLADATTQPVSYKQFIISCSDLS